MSRPERILNKKLIVCCDGTWQDGDSGYKKPSMVPYQPMAMLQIPSNVVRISRAIKKQDFENMDQIIYYHAGVGSGASFTNRITGGLLGTGLSENVREGYSFLTNNYIPGDEIILIGFSRGAFTARSIAGLISDIGLLNRKGMDSFYAIFKDVENSRTRGYHDLFPDIPFSNKPQGTRRTKREYKRRLFEEGLTRVADPDGKQIEVYAVAVWDTVGSLGIPTLGWMQKMGLPHATKELKFYNTALNNHIRHAFQALALDEHRRPFSPAVWERRDDEDCNTDLRQVWFPGAHSNVGGGYADQEIANITLAWMMDQLASIGVEFDPETIDRIFNENSNYFRHPKKESQPLLSRTTFSRSDSMWADQKIYNLHQPVRPWALGKIHDSETGFYLLAGRNVRTPGLYRRADPETGKETDEFMTNTNERVHASVRLRMDMGGLGLDDVGYYDCPALTSSKLGPWKLRKIRIKVRDAIRRNVEWGAIASSEGPIIGEETESLRWAWIWGGDRHDAPKETIMVEDVIGPYERKLLGLSEGMFDFVFGAQGAVAWGPDISYFDGAADVEPSEDVVIHELPTSETTALGDDLVGKE